jgi:hypothetical protein
MTKMHLPAILISNGHYVTGGDRRVRSTHFYDLQRSRQKPHVFFTPLVAGTAANILPGSHPCNSFSDRSDLQFTGLENCVRLEKAGGPAVYVMDNHLMAYFAWHEARLTGHLDKGAILLHIDAHPDDALRPPPGLELTLGDAANFVRRELNNANFIMPALRQQLLGEFWWAYTFLTGGRISFGCPGGLVGNSNQLPGGRVQIRPLNKDVPVSEIIARANSRERFALDIDLDAFVRMNYKDQLPDERSFAAAEDFLAQIAQQAGVVTIATSPGFADQRLAIPLAQRLAAKIIN